MPNASSWALGFDAEEPCSLGAFAKGFRFIRHIVVVCVEVGGGLGGGGIDFGIVSQQVYNTMEFDRCRLVTL